ncbi:hypothetical protein JTB14_018104 [Gonioctena quinquepunctata]|nr:hypothetical protein JTB14_018104 [Gonioctena quinquepunctata]
MHSESRKPSDNNSQGNSFSDPEHYVSHIKKVRKAIKPTITPPINEPTPDPFWIADRRHRIQPDYEFLSNTVNTRRAYNISPQTPGESPYHEHLVEDSYARQFDPHTFGCHHRIGQTPIFPSIGINNKNHVGVPHSFGNTCTNFHDSGPEAISQYSGDDSNTQSNAPNQQGWKSIISTEKENFPEESAPEQGKVVLQANVLLNPEAPEGPSSEIAGENTKVTNEGVLEESDQSPPPKNGKCGESQIQTGVEQQQQGLTTEKTQVHGKCSKNPILLETPSELSETENKISGKCGENPIIFQKPLQTAKESITQGNVLPTPLVGNQMMLTVRQQKERAQAQAELDKQIAYVSEYQAEANNDQIIEAMDCQTTPHIVVEVAQIHQDQTEKPREGNKIGNNEQNKPPLKSITRRLRDSDTPLPESWNEITNMIKEEKQNQDIRNEQLLEKRALEAKLKHERKLPRRKSMDENISIIERDAINIKTTNGTVILRAGPTPPGIYDGGKMIEKKAKRTMHTSHKGREMENDSSDTESQYHYYEEELNKLMSNLKTEARQQAENYLDQIATIKTGIEEIDNNTILESCRQKIYDNYDTHYRKRYSAEIQRLTKLSERHREPPESYRKNKKLEFKGSERKPIEVILRQGDFPPLIQRTETFKKPETSTKKGRQLNTNPRNNIVETSNMFQLLSDMGTETEPDEQEHERDMSEEHSREVIQTITNKNKKPTPQPVVNTDKKIPPIVVEGRMPMSRRITKTIKEKLKGQYTVEYKPRSTLIYTTNAEDHTAIRKLLLELEMEFHSYTNKAEKTHAFVIRGLESAPTPEELEEALKEEHQLKNQSLKNTQQPRNEERRIQPTQGSPSIPEFPSQVVSGVTGGGSENSGLSLEDITNRIKRVNSLIDLPKMVKRLDALINDIINARGDEKQFRALVRYTIGGCGNP